MVSSKVIGIFAAGVLLSPFLMPVILALIPVLIGLGCLLGAGIAYLVMAKGCRYRDFRFVAKGIWLKILIRLRGDKMVVPATFAKTMAEVGEHAPMITFVDDDKVYTYGDVDALSNQIARAMLAEKLGVGETVSLYMGNRPEYIATWLGVSKMGGRTALLNNNLRTKALLHGLKESQSKILIFDAASIDVIEESFEDIEAMGLKLFCYDEECDFAPCLVETMSELASSALPVEQTAAAKGVTVKDPVLYIFTSGTTGLPKAAVVTHFRYLYASLAFTLMFNYTKNDRVYTTMPLYHSAAGIIGVGSLIQTGCSMVLRSKFSKSQFVRDVRKYNCTIMQYIGELCRYLLAAPVTNYDSDTSLRLAIGNGLRPDIWDEFKTRFGIKQIGEFYAATEGAAALINTEDKKGSIGFLSPIIQLIQPQGCIEFSVEEEKPIRGADGLAKFCKPNQEGEFVAMIKVEKNGTSNFSGYTNKEASNKKIMTDVKTKGDRWFRSGDLLRIDEEGFVYFVDRIGDTFRWKGENVSTNEVAEIVAGYGFHEINVYGVKTPAGDGRAGMMSIVGVDPGTVDFEALAAYVSANLAKYARPIFIRFQEAMEVTGTFKHKKVELRNQGYDPNKCGGDPLFFYNGKSYEPLTEQLFADIEAGNVNL